MNWFKIATHDINNWDITSENLKKELGRQPSPKEVQRELVRKSFDDSNKEDE